MYTKIKYQHLIKELFFSRSKINNENKENK